MSKITEKISELRILEANQSSLKAQVDSLRAEIMQELRKEGLTQVKTPTETVSIAKKITQQVNVVTWQAWANQQPDLDMEYFFTRSLDTKLVAAHAEGWKKTTGEVVPGITPVETEYLQVRKAKEE